MNGPPRGTAGYSSGKGTAVTLRIARDRCAGCGTCAEICPEIFLMDVDLASVKTAVVAEDLQNACRQAAESCPLEAIIIE